MNHRGFTLVELIATMVVLIALGMVSAGILFTATDGYLSASTTALLHQEASLVMDRMTRELREIERAASSTAPWIDEVTPTAIRWQNDSMFTLEGASLLFIQAGEAPAVLADSVAAFTIETFDESGEQLPEDISGDACRDIHRIRLTLTLSRHGVSETVRSGVFPRAAMHFGGVHP